MIKVPRILVNQNQQWYMDTRLQALIDPLNEPSAAKQYSRHEVQNLFIQFAINNEFINQLSYQYTYPKDSCISKLLR